MKNWKPYYAISCGNDHVAVLGLPDMGVYEFQIQRFGGDDSPMSDNGYGSPEAALRAGLNFWFEGQ